MPERVNLAAGRRFGGPRSATRRRPATVPAKARIPLPGDPYELWVRGELLEAMGIREDGRTRVEIIGGEIVVSPGPTLRLARIVGLPAKAFDQRQVTRPDYPRPRTPTPVT